MRKQMILWIVMLWSVFSAAGQVRYPNAVAGPEGIYVNCGNHGPGCGHEAVPHGNHIDFLVNGRLHHPHGDHCDDHGPVEVVQG